MRCHIGVVSPNYPKHPLRPSCPSSSVSSSLSQESRFCRDTFPILLEPLFIFPFICSGDYLDIADNPLLGISSLISCRADKNGRFCVLSAGDLSQSPSLSAISIPFSSSSCQPSSLTPLSDEDPKSPPWFQQLYLLQQSFEQGFCWTFSQEET